MCFTNPTEQSTIFQFTNQKFQMTIENCEKGKCRIFYCCENTAAVIDKCCNKKETKKNTVLISVYKPRTTRVMKAKWHQNNH